MPYQVIKKNNAYAVMTKDTGKTHGYTTKKNADAQKRILEALMKSKKM